MLNSFSQFRCCLIFTLSLLCLWQFQIIASAEAIDDATLILTFDKDTMKINDGKPIQVTNISGNKNHGLINGKGGKSVGGDPPKIVLGKHGNALQFSGKNWVEVVDSKTLRITDALTITASVRPESLVGVQTICTKDCSYYLQLRTRLIGNYAYNLTRITQGCLVKLMVAPGSVLGWD